MQSGSRMLTTCASARASRSAWRSSAAAAARIAGRGAGGQPLASRAPGAVRIGRQRRAAEEGLDAAALAAPAGRAGIFLGASSRAAGCGPIRRRRGCGLPGCARRRRSRPPTPVPRMTAKTTPYPAPAPSAASLMARQLASLRAAPAGPAARRGRRPAGRRSARWNCAPRTSPVAGDRLPGMPMPTCRAPPSSASARLHQRADQADHPGIVAAGSAPGGAAGTAPVGIQRHDLRLGPAEVDAEPPHAAKVLDLGCAPQACYARPVPGLGSETLLDVQGLSCPLPVLKANKALRGLPPGPQLMVLATDPAARRTSPPIAARPATSCLPPPRPTGSGASSCARRMWTGTGA